MNEGMCPRCGHQMDLDRAEVSRWDNETGVCSWCGLDEWVLQATAGRATLGNFTPESILDPVIGRRPWKVQP